jgi:hypothetical protein
MRFDIKHVSRGQDSYRADAVFEITIMSEDGVNLTQSFSHYQIQDLEMFKLSPEANIRSRAFLETGPAKLLLLVGLSNLAESEKVDLVFTPDSTKYSQGYHLLGDPKVIGLVFNGGVKEADIKSAEKSAEVTSTLNSYGATTAETTSMALSFFSLD